MENNSSTNTTNHREKGFVKSCKRYFKALRMKVKTGKEIPQNSEKECVCLNCGTKFIGNYCNRCGQSASTFQYHFKKIPEIIASELFLIEDGFSNTLLNLLYRPGYMIRDFIQGKRVNYIQPFHLLFILATLYLMFSSIAKPIFSPDISQKDTIENTVSTPDTVATDEAEEEARIIVEKVKAQVDNFLADNKVFVHVVNYLEKAFGNNRAVQSIFTLPIAALLTMLVFRRKNKTTYQYNYTEYIIIEGFVYSQDLLINILYIPFAHTSMDVFWFVIPFQLYAYKQIFQLGWFSTIWRAFLIYVYLILFIILILFAVVILYYSF